MRCHDQYYQSCSGFDSTTGATSLSSLVASSHQSLRHPVQRELQGLDELYSHTRMVVSPTGDEVLVLRKGDHAIPTSPSRSSRGAFQRADFLIDASGERLSQSVGNETVLIAREQQYERLSSPYD